MLRKACFLIALMMVITGIVLVISGFSVGWPIALWSAVAFISIVFERWRYKKNSERLTGTWQKTDERFIDPETGALTQVIYNDHTGERRYEVIDNKLSK